MKGNTYTNAVRGEAHYAARLTADDVRLIRAAAEERARLRAEAVRLSNFALADKFGVSKSLIERVIARDAWSHV